MLITNATAFASTVYHYIVVGGGTAGLTVAARLSENPDIRVGVIEAGLWRNEDPRVYIPGLFGSGVGSELDWGFQTAPSEHLDGRRIGFARGKMLGGSSGLNFMLWGRAGEKEYDNWEKLGNPGWNWREILKYSKKSQTIHAPTLESQLELAPDPPYVPEYHGNSGPVSTSFVRWFVRGVKAFYPTLEKLGVQTNKEPMSGNNIGGFVSLSSIDPHTVTRSYSATAYLQPNINKSNLVVLTGATVSKILFTENRVAIGVEFVTGGEKFFVRASKEVILSAGSIQSPQLLELSGIGNRSLLKKHGIKPIVNNPNVGENLQEHYFVPNTYEFVPGTITNDLLSNPEFQAAARAEYAANKTGILTSNNPLYAMLSLSNVMSRKDIATIVQATVKSSSNPNRSIRDRHLDATMLSQLTSPDVGQVEILCSPRKTSPTAPGEPGKTYLSLMAAVMIPHSRGSIHINSSNHLDFPIIEPQAFSQDTDRKVMVAGLRFADKLSQTMPLKQYIVRRIEPADNGNLQLTDEEWWAHARKTAQTVKHPIGTCAMLPQAKGGVVDHKLRVYGVKGLRVVDASIIPLHMAAHIQATVYAIAEKAVDLILEGP